MIRMVFLGLFLVMSNANAGVDNHYSKVGFFDIHVCNWSDRPLFLMTLFSTANYEKIRSIKVYTPDNQLLTQIGMVKYRILKRKNKTDKHVFMQHVAIPKDQANGWYTARVTLEDGTVDETKDYVIITTLDTPTQLYPAHESTVKAKGLRLQWAPIDGARYYQVFINDLWDAEKNILRSKLLDKPYLDLPQDLIQEDGWYAWRVHARDINEHPLLGDFNHGTLSSEHHFTTFYE